MAQKISIIDNIELECSLAIFTSINFKLDSGAILNDITIAFKTFGKLNKEKNNAILVCHALTGDQYLTGQNPITKKDGWWSRMVGPEKPINTNNFFVICSNVLGGCAGSTGPKEKNPSTKESYAANFPSVTIRDMVKAQVSLIDSLQINRLFAVIRSC